MDEFLGCSKIHQKTVYGFRFYSLWVGLSFESLGSIGWVPNRVFEWVSNWI